MKIHLPKFTTFKLVAVATLAIGVLLVTPRVKAVVAQPTPAVKQLNQLTLTAIPPRLGDAGKLTGNPGQTIQTSIRVKNNSVKPVRVDSQALDFILADDNKTPIPLTGASDISNRWSLASWITLVPNSQVLKPNETKAISLVIEIPKNALPGGHYAMIVHQPSLSLVKLKQPNQGQLDTLTGVNQRVGTLLYLIVKGNINEEAMIREFKFPHLSEFGPIPFSFTVENMSDVHIRPALEVTIKNLFGKTVAKIPLETKNIFPLTSRQFQGSWQKVWGTGHYTATVTVAYGDHGKLAIAKTAFWFLPVTLIAAILVVLLTLLAAGIAIRRHLIYRKESQAKKIAELETELAEMEKKEHHES